MTERTGKSEARLAGLKERISQYRQQARTAQAALKRQIKHAAMLQKDMAKAQQEIALLKERLEAFGAGQSSGNRRTKAVQETIAALQAELKVQKRKTAGAKASATRQRNMLAKKKEALQNARADMDTWKARAEETSEEAELAESAFIVRSLEYTKKIQRLANDLAASEQGLRAMKASTSWRITAPVRAAKGLWGRFKKTPASEGMGLLAGPFTAKKGKQAPVRYVPKLESAPLQNPPVRAIAFYLPQYHAIPENDAWWGEGFTEWTNVKPAKPLFKGHYQPHVPDALGYYDLSTPEVMAQQIDLARLYGLGGFCFYFYWFGGKTLLETPVRNFLEDKSLNFPFCLCWANENWSRRWDGLDDDVLIGQSHSAKDDIDFIKHIAPYVHDSRYIKVNGKPLIIIYRPQLFPNPRATAKRWRAWCRKNGIGEIYLAYTQSFETVDPAQYGFDAAIEFSPNNMGVPPSTARQPAASSKFDGHALEWTYLLERSRHYQEPPYPLHRSVCPSWDNTARRGTKATVFLNSSPNDFQELFSNAVQDSCKRFTTASERLVFINAWNEWAEGTHLEPDRKYGYAWLQAIRRALEDDTAAPSKNIVVVSHDAHPHGAQYLSLNIARTLKEKFGYTVDIVLLGEGPLKPDFEDVADVHDLSGCEASSETARQLAQGLRAAGVKISICNTTVSGLFSQTLNQAGIKVISLIHELPSVIEQYGLQEHTRTIAKNAQKIVFPAKLVAEAFKSYAPVLANQQVLRPQGIYKRNRCRSVAQIKAAAVQLRTLLNLPKSTKIILGVGYADKRKGFDLFVEAAESMAKTHKDIVFVWAGHPEVHLSKELADRTRALCNQGRLVLPGLVKDTDPFYAGADVYVLTSREDPYPSTVLEALDVGLPVIGFEGVTGTTGLIGKSGGILLQAFDVKALMQAIISLAGNKDKNARVSRLTAFRSRQDISFQGYIYELLDQMGHAPKKVSVVVPNFNYAHFLPDRIGSILAQGYPVSELIILDDASTDNSQKVIEALVADVDIPVQVIVNAKNSGSVFRQWLKGVKAASGDYVWIAEADDLCEPDFLEKAMQGFDEDDVILSYTQSKQMAHDGTILCNDYLDYVKNVSPTQWRSSYKRSGVDEINNGLSVKNTIPNVSAVVFQRKALLKTMQLHMKDILHYRVAGDWCIYVNLLRHGSIHFNARSLNLHRRHDDSVTIRSFGPKELGEIKQMQDYVAGIHKIDPNYRFMASTYLDELKKQFNL